MKNGNTAKLEELVFERKEEKEKTSEPYPKQGTGDNRLLPFNKHGRCARQTISEPIYSY